MDTNPSCKSLLWATVNDIKDGSDFHYRLRANPVCAQMYQYIFAYFFPHCALYPVRRSLASSGSVSVKERYKHSFTKQKWMKGVVRRNVTATVLRTSRSITLWNLWCYTGMWCGRSTNGTFLTGWRWVRCCYRHLINLPRSLLAWNIIEVRTIHLSQACTPSVP